LAAFMSQEAFHYATYNYGVLDSNDDDQNNLNKDLPYGGNKGEWTFLYFGFDWR
jgi:hypothetical protein